MARLPEEELLLCCARVHLEPATRDRLRRLLAGPLDWAAVLRLARRHWVTSLLYWHLHNEAAAFVPEPVLRQLAEQFHANARRNLQLVGALRHILQVLEAEGIPALAYKGPLLAARLYGNLALRDCCDVDVLVGKRDILRAKALLAAGGYHPRLAYSNAQEAARLDARCEFELQDRTGRTAVDLHWEVVPASFCPRLGADDLLARRVTEPLDHLAVPTLAPEDLFLVLCVHGGKHAWAQLKWISDVAAMLKSCGALRWPLLLERAASLGVERLVLIAILLAQRLLDAPIPEAVTGRLAADRRARRLADDLAGRLFTDRRPAQALIERTLFWLTARERWRDKLRQAVWLVAVPTEEDVQVFRLPRGLRGAAALLRPLRLLGRYGIPWLARR
jgi:hypothetical protein